MAKINSGPVLMLFGFILQVFSQISGPISSNTSNREDKPTRLLYTVSTVQHAPWVIKTAEGYTGLVVDILDRVSALSGFDYQLQEPLDGNYGQLNYETGKFDGIIGDVLTKRADIGAADLAVSDTRSNAVSFSSPFAETGAQILLQKPVTSRNMVTFLFKPFTSETWCLFIAVFVVMGIAFYTISRCRPRGQNLKDGGWSKQCNFLHSQLPCQNKTACQRPKSSTALLVTWWYLLIALVSLYTSNLVCAILYHGSIHNTLPFKSYHEMVNQPDIAYGGWFGMKLNLNDDLHKRIDKFINSKYTYYNNIDEAITKITTSNGRFVAIVDGYMAKSIINKNCDLVLLKDQLIEIYYSFACQKSTHGETLCESISDSLDILRQNGTLFRLFDYWWEKLDSQCTVSMEEEYESRHGRMGIRFEPMSTIEVIPVFLVVLLGVIVSVAFLALEIVCRQALEKKDATATDIEETNSMIKVSNPESNKQG